MPRTASIRKSIIRAGRPSSTTSRTLSAFALTSVANALLLWYFHDRYWYPTDDGFYAHIAERLLSGEVLNRDIQDIHPGYITFLHAAAFRLFGIDMVSLRYPLMLSGFVQSAFVYALLRPRSVVFAVVGSICSIALGVIQFVDPTPNWYCLCFAAMLGCWLEWMPKNRAERLVGAGVLVGLIALFRQLTGVWVMMAVLVTAILERSVVATGRKLLLSRALLLILLGGLTWYLVVSPETEPGGIVLIAMWPLLILGWAFFNARTSNADTFRILLQVATGCAVAAIPLVVYHTAHGSFGGWFNDTVLAAFGETQMEFFGRGWYGILPLAALVQATSTFDPVKIANSFYWVVLPLLSAANGIGIIAHFREKRPVEKLTLPILAAFYALVSLYFEGPLYLYYSVSFTLAAVLWLHADRSRSRRLLLSISGGIVGMIAVICHAGESRLRTPLEILAGRQVSPPWTAVESGLARCSLRIPQADRAVFQQLVRAIERYTTPGEAILALPNDAELYFLTGRRNPLRFYNSALGIRTEAELADVVHTLEEAPPAAVVFRPGDKYNTALTLDLMKRLCTRYVLVDTIAGLELRRRVR